MNNIHHIEFHTGSKEELFPDFSVDFPYIASRAELDKYAGRFVPWQSGAAGRSLSVQITF